MRRLFPLLLTSVLLSLAVWTVSCEGDVRDTVPVRPFDLAPEQLDLRFEPPVPDLRPAPDQRPADGGGAGDGGAGDAGAGDAGVAG